MAFEGGDGVGHGNALDVLGCDFGNRAGGHALFLASVSHHNHFTDQLGVHLEVHLQGLVVDQRKGLGLVPDVAHGDVHGKLTHLQKERAVCVGAGACGGAFLKDGGADQHFFGAGVVHRAGDGGALGKAGARMEQQHSEKRDARRLPKVGQELNHKVFGSWPWEGRCSFQLPAGRVEVTLFCAPSKWAPTQGTAHFSAQTVSKTHQCTTTNETLDRPLVAVYVPAGQSAVGTTD